jgi:folate-binding protein YgfZ
MSTLDFEATEAALRSGVVGRVVERAVIRVQGADARSYLQGQLSQDVDRLAVGEGADALLLSPNGKLEAYVRVSLLGPEDLLVDLDPDYGDAALARLARFKLRVKATLSLEHWHMVELRGRGAGAVVEPGLHGDEAIALEVHWPGLVGVDLLGPDVELPAGVDAGDAIALDLARIEAGWPKMGSELTERTIAAEAGIVDRTVSFTKGCYTGQELVARLDARGSNVPRRLHAFVAETDAAHAPVPGDVFLAGEREVGEVTSVAYSPARHAAIGLAYVRREVVAPCDVTLRAAGGTVTAHVEALPTED